MLPAICHRRHMANFLTIPPLSQASPVDDISSGQAAAWIDWQRGTVASNASFRRLNDSLDLTRTAPLFAWKDNGTQEGWRSFLKTLELDPSRECRHLLMVSSWLDHGEVITSITAHYDPHQQTIALIVVDVYGLPVPQRAGSILSSVFGLTAAEAQCALLLIEGVTPSEIAQRRQTRPSTVKSQMKAIREKLGVSSILNAIIRLRTVQFLYL